MAATAEQAPPLDTWVIEPRREALADRLRDVWRYRRLLRFFAAKSLTKLYKRTVLGAAWIFIRPLFPLVVNTIVFGGVLGVGSNGVPYFLFINCGGALWDLFSAGGDVGDAQPRVESRVHDAHLSASPHSAGRDDDARVSELRHQPRGARDRDHVLPRDDRCVVSDPLASRMGVARGRRGEPPRARNRALDVSAGAAGTRRALHDWLCPRLLAVSDASPVSVECGTEYAWLLALNPMVAPVNAFKYGVLGIGGVSATEWISSAIMTTIAFISGLWFFGRAEADAADKV